MKINSLFIAALVLISSVAVAGKDEPRKTGFVVVPVKGSEVFKVIYKGETTGKVKLNIYSASGATIYSETLNGTSGFIYPVNFSGLSSGEYTIEVVDASGKKTEKVKYYPVRNVDFVRVVKLAKEQDKFLVSVVNTGKESMSFKIYDSKFNLIYSENKEINGDLAWVYKLPAGSASYTFEVTDKSGNSKTVNF